MQRRSCPLLSPAGFCFALASLLVVTNCDATEQDSGSERNKRALIVAIGDYPAPSIYGYAKINAGNDVPLVKRAYLSQGFAENEIHVLMDEDATRNGILEAFRTYLIEGSETGDVVAFHYSGHGHRITDNNGDEIDGYDEILVPYGAPGTFVAGYAGEKHIRDDEFGALLTELRERLGPNGSVLVTIDACFSGSITRGAQRLPVRGVAAPLGAPAANRGMVERGIFEEPQSTNNLAPLVVFSAARHDELDQEVRDGVNPVGPLSLAMARVFPAAKAGVSYSAVFEQIRLQMATLVSRQTPQAEGNVDAGLFGAPGTEVRNFFRVSEVEKDSIAFVDAGALLGMTVGSGVAFYDLSATGDDPPVASGRVLSSDEVSSEVVITTLDAGADLASTRAFITEQTFSENQVTVSLEVNSENDLMPFRESLQASGVVISGTAPDLLLTSRGEDIILESAIEDVLIAGPLAADDPDAPRLIAERVRGYARNRYLSQIEMKDPVLGIRLELVPATHEFNRRGECRSSDMTTYSAERTPGGWKLMLGDGFKLRIHNEGRISAYVAVLSMTSDGGISQLYPLDEGAISDNVIAAGQSRMIDLCYEAAEPVGNEILKVFATRDQVDFRPVLNSGGITRGGEELGFFESLVASSLTRTRAATARRRRGTGATHAIAIRVVK
jgi:metacaspase-1